MSRIQMLCRPAARFALPLLLVAASVASTAVTADAQALSVKLRSNRGDGAVYQPGDPISLSVKTNRDANLIVYEIDAEGEVHVLFPTEGTDTQVDGGQTLNLPEDSGEQLVVEGPVGEGYIVAIASEDPFKQLPWYLRPADPRAAELGYTTDDNRDTEGVTAEGKIVGDPFVAMERIRRAVLAHGVDSHSFATAYTSYYVHNEVRYPRYLCNDCHRPGYYSWWSGFDPYYANCSAFEFRVNSGWWWGPTYWSGYVPYYAYVYRTDCPPRYRPRGARAGIWYSSWDGWTRWTATWGGPLRRTKSEPPPGYVPPGRWNNERPPGSGSTLPPGFLASAHDRWGRNNQPGGGQPSGIRRERIDGGGTSSGGSTGGARWGREGRNSGGQAPGTTTTQPSEQGRSRRGWDQGSGSSDRGNDSGTPAPRGEARESRPQPRDQGNWKPAPAQPREQAPAPRNADPGAQRPERRADPPPQNDPPKESTPPQSSPAPSERPKRGGGSWNP